MNATLLLLSAALLALIAWWARHLPLFGWRKRAALGGRIIAVAALCLALWEAPHRRSEEVPHQVLYLVDGSESIDPAQREWMARRISSLEALRPARVPRAVMVFGGEAGLVVPFGRDRLDDPEELAARLEQASIARERTSLEAALLGAISVFDPPARGRIILLSDGRETAGNVSELLAYLRRLGVEVFTEAAPPTKASAAVWEELALPPVVQRGSPVAVQLVVFNGAPRAKTAEVTVSMQGVPLKRRRFPLRPGWQVLGLSVPAIQRGAMGLTVRLAVPEDGMVEERQAYTEVEGPPQLLLVSEQLSAMPALGQALRQRGIDIALAQPAELASEAAALEPLDGVLLFNVAKSSVSAAQAEALRAYVEAGGGLIQVGLGGDLAAEITTPAALDPLLPIAFEPKGLQEAKRRVCIMLLIDRSASMMGPRIAATKRAAVGLVKQLAPEDLVGVLAFDTQPYVVVEVQPAGQVGSWLVEKLVKLRSSGGTDVYPALTASANRLELTDASVKHIILLSDGNTPVNLKAYRTLLTSFREQGITISTIGIGAAFINEDYLQWVAMSTGGVYHQMRSLDELPQLIARDTQQALGRLPFTEGSFRPVKSPTTEWFADRDDFPSLKGYLTATAKPGAQVDLTISSGEADEPLLVRWALGQGRVVSFTSDADTRWAPEWIRWPGFEGAWAQIARWAMRPKLAEEVFVSVEQSGETPHLVIEGALQEPQASLLDSGGAQPRALALIQTAAWRWEAPLPNVPSGWHQLLLESGAASSAEAARVFATRWIELGTPPALHESAGQPPREELLRRIAQATSGSYGAPDGAFLPPAARVTVFTPALLWWVPFVILGLLVDVAARGSSML